VPGKGPERGRERRETTYRSDNLSSATAAKCNKSGDVRTIINARGVKEKTR